MSKLKRKSKDHSWLLTLPAALAIPACGGGGTAINDQEQLDLNGERSDGTNNVAPSFYGLPEIISNGETEIGTLIIVDENWQTVDVDVQSLSEIPILISEDNSVYIGISQESLGTFQLEQYVFVVRLEDEAGNVTEQNVSIDVLESDEYLVVESDAVSQGANPVIISHEEVTSGSIIINVNIDHANYEQTNNLEGMFFKIQFDPNAVEIVAETIKSAHFDFPYIQVDQSEQGILTIGGLTLDPVHSENEILFSFNVREIVDIESVEIAFLDMDINGALYSNFSETFII